jgi:ABC-type taurine transport system ATPase subunit
LLTKRKDGKKRRIRDPQDMDHFCDLDKEEGALLDLGTKSVVGTWPFHSVDEAILLSDRIVVMTARPGRIKEIIQNPLRRPRSTELISTSIYEALFKDVWSLIKEEVVKTKTAISSS